MAVECSPKHNIIEIDAIAYKIHINYLQLTQTLSQLHRLVYRRFQFAEGNPEGG